MKVSPSWYADGGYCVFITVAEDFACSCPPAMPVSTPILSLARAWQLYSSIAGKPLALGRA